MLQLVYSASEQVPPFKIETIREDYLKIYVIALVMIFSGALLFRYFVARIKIHQAVKLGEE